MYREHRDQRVDALLGPIGDLDINGNDMAALRWIAANGDRRLVAALADLVWRARQAKALR